MASDIDLAVALERIRGLEATVALLQEALLAASSARVVVGDSTAGPMGPGFALLAKQALANADEPEEVPGINTTTAPKAPPAVRWFRADGTDPKVALDAEKVEAA